MTLYLVMPAVVSAPAIESAAGEHFFLSCAVDVVHPDWPHATAETLSLCATLAAQLLAHHLRVRICECVLYKNIFSFRYHIFVHTRNNMSEF